MEGVTYHVVFLEPENGEAGIRAECTAEDATEPTVIAELSFEHLEEENRWVCKPVCDIHDDRLGAGKPVQYKLERRTLIGWGELATADGMDEEIPFQESSREDTLRCVITWEGETGKTVEITLGNVPLEG